jgi:hypothetical protein
MAAGGVNVPIIAVHAYADSSSGITSAVTSAINQVAGGRPVWLTEFNVPTPYRADFDSSFKRDTIQTHLMGGVLNKMKAIDGWEKTFPYRLIAADSDSVVSLLRPTWNGSTYPRKDPWYMFQIFATHGNQGWIPTYRWWRQWSGMVGTDPNEGYASGYSLQESNAWSGSLHGFTGWRPLFRCSVSDPATNDGHYIGTRHTCDERSVTGNNTLYPRDGTVDGSYGYVSMFNWTDVGLQPLVRFQHDFYTDYVQTTSVTEQYQLRSSWFYNDGWRDVDVLGYAWPSGFVP